MINSPVAYNLFRRPEISKVVFNEIKVLKPKKMYLFSDGPRNQDEKELVEFNRSQIVKMVDWDCDLRIHFLNDNIGFSRMWDFTFSTVFEEDDRIIILEEDIMPSPDFFIFCDELLEHYINDESIYQIGGSTGLVNYPKKQNPSYIFNAVASSWGMATWKRSYLRRTKNIEEINKDSYYSDVVRKRLIDIYGKNGWIRDYDLISSRKDLMLDSAEFWFLGFNEFLLYNALAIIPSVNLVKNLGNSEGAENSDIDKFLPKKMRVAYERQISKMSFPLVHPKYKIIDSNYDFLISEQYGLGKIGYIVMRFERAFRILFFGGPKKFVKKLSLYFKRVILRIRYLINV